MRSWTIEEALAFIRDLQVVVKPTGFNLGLLGSVLYNGRSRHDLDLVVFPSHSEYLAYTDLEEVLVLFGLKRVADCEKVHQVWRKFGSSDTKHVEVWSWGKKRVDLFFLK